ncbi:unnamed protein product, partial [Rotaria sp. Silwood2]
MNTKKGNEYLALSEAVFDILNYGYGVNMASNFNLIKSRYIKDEKGIYNLSIGASPDEIYEADVIKNIGALDLLNSNGLKKHQFKLLKTIQYNNNDTYVIGFDQKDDVEESLYIGKLYIDAESLAFVAIDYRRSKKGIQYAKIGSGSMRTLMKLMGIDIDILSESTFVSYQKLNGKWLLSNVKSNTLLQYTTQYRIGSLTKTFTSLLIMQLIAENKLSLQDTIGKFLPTYVNKHITIQQLLTHTSGIPSYTNDMEKLLSVMRKEQSLKEIISGLCSEPLEFASGSQFHYSNSGYTILAGIIEIITGKEFGQVLREKIFTPLSMTQTSFGTNPTNSKGYYLGSIEPNYIIKNMAGAAGISSSATDLLKWDEALKTDKLISQTILTQSFLPRAAYDDWDADYGFGWMIDKKMFRQSKSHKIIYHPGTDNGYYSMFVRQPDADNLIIMLSNNGDFP